MLNDIDEYEFKKGAKDSDYFMKQFIDPVEGEEQPPVQDGGDDELKEIENKYKMLKVLA